MTSRAAPHDAGPKAGVARSTPADDTPPGEAWPRRGPADRMLLLHTAALPTLRRHRHRQLGRLCVPGCRSRLRDTLDLMPVAFDTGCFHGLDPVAVCRMYEQIAGWPAMGARLAKAYPWARTLSSVTYLADGGFREQLVLGGLLPDIHPNVRAGSVRHVGRMDAAYRLDSSSPRSSIAASRSAREWA